MSAFIDPGNDHDSVDVASRDKRDPTVSIVITTRNRKQELRRAIESCLAQTGDCFDVWVYDDDSTDGTTEDVRARFPEVNVIRCRSRRGLIVRRNEALCHVPGRLIISLDDDAYFTNRGTVMRVIELFEEYPKAAVVALPFIEPSRPNGETLDATLTVGTPVRNFVGCSHALRRDAILELKGYRELFVHQGEERDLSIRLLDRDNLIIAGDTPPIVHCPSQRRDRDRMEYYGFRNTLLFHWLNCPGRYLPLRLLGSTAQLLRHHFSLRRLPVRSQALIAGWMGGLLYWQQRSPVSLATYREFRSLPYHGPLASDEMIPACTRDEQVRQRVETPETSTDRLVHAVSL